LVATEIIPFDSDRLSIKSRRSEILQGISSTCGLIPLCLRSGLCALQANAASAAGGYGSKDRHCHSFDLPKIQTFAPRRSYSMRLEKPNRNFSSQGLWLVHFTDLFPLYIIASQLILIADVKFAAHYRVRPAIPAPVIDREAPFLDIGIRIGFGQPDHLFLAEQI
jgi:hypothetical protein